MKYKNAGDVLPNKLLKELQKYISGETIYIPTIDDKKIWGEVSGARDFYNTRNAKIKERYKKGATLEILADEFNLSIDSIRKIVY